MRILFILPYDNTYKYKGSFTKAISYAPLTLSVLAALVPKEIKAEIKIIDEGVQKGDYSSDYDIVFITCVTSSAKRAYELSHYFREKKSYVVLGGVHPTLMPEEAGAHANSIFMGLAEETFPEFIKDYLNGAPKKSYQQVAQCQHLAMPVPRRDLISTAYINIPTVVANRGCQNSCAYCCIHQLWGHQGLTRPIDEVIREIKGLNSRRIILLDPSPSSNEAYAEEFFKALIPLKIKWSGLSTIDVVHHPKLFDLMVKSGCEGILAGFESINKENLVAVGKSTNKVDDYKYAIRQFHHADIPVLGCFVAGFDSDTRESLMETVDFIDEIGVDLPRFSILTPFPGTKMFEEYDKTGRILSKDWNRYDTMHVVFQPKNMDPQELQRTFYDMWKKSYTLKRIIKRINNTRYEKIIKLGANMGFKYYAHKLSKDGINNDFSRENY
ncbi:MAG: B12-binding domain-containing radical SAM protein [Acetobacterium sp.]